MTTHLIYDEEVFTKNPIGEALNEVSEAIYDVQILRHPNIFQIDEKEKAIETIINQTVFPTFVRSSISSTKECIETLTSGLTKEYAETFLNFLLNNYRADFKEYFNPIRYISKMLEKDRRITIMTKLPYTFFAIIYDLTQESDLGIAMKSKKLKILTPAEYYPLNTIPVYYAIRKSLLERAAHEVRLSTEKRAFFIGYSISDVYSVGNKLKKDEKENKSAILVERERPNNIDLIDHYVPHFNGLDDLLELSELEKFKDVKKLDYVKEKKK